MARGRYFFDALGQNALSCQRVTTASPARAVEAAKPSVTDRAIIELAQASRAAVEAARGAMPSVDLGGWIKWVVIGIVGILGIQMIGLVRGR